MDISTSLRERTRRAVAAEITVAALELFTAQGYDETTVDQIAGAAGLSRRSFFRYFSSKEQVLLQQLDATGQHLAEALVRRPAHEDAWTALRRAFDELVTTADADPDRSVVLLDMLLSSPTLHGAHLAKQAAWQELLAEGLQQRSSPPEDGTDRPSTITPMVAAALAGSALACLEVAQTTWVRGRKVTHASGSALSQRPAWTSAPSDLASLVDEAMGSVHPLSA